jgi:hypothetical protein
MKKRLWLLAAALIAAASVVGTAVSSPATPAFDRGLPTANLNDAAGANRSNVAWSDGNDYVTGDDFTLGATGEKWYVSQIRTWNIGHLGMFFGDEFGTDTLYFGTGAISPIMSGTVPTGSNVDSNPNITHTKVQYVGGVDYQASDTTYRQIWQNDFKNVGLVVNGGQKYYFGVDGTPYSYFWFNHASNATLSGSPQQGADNHFAAWAKSDLSTRYSCDSSGGSGVCDGGWDKSSDINVQVFASQVATGKDACKNNGWQSLVRADGSTFKNQGDCIQYVNTGK